MKLTQLDKDFLRRSLKATIEGPFFDEWEFETLIGFTRDEVAEIEKEWDNIDFEEPDVRDMIKSVIGNLAGYPHSQKKDLEDFLPQSTIIELHEKLKSL